MALAARNTARSYRRLKWKYPEPEFIEALEREARVSFRRAIFWVRRARRERFRGTKSPRKERQS
jgi:hypothetical protein